MKQNSYIMVTSMHWPSKGQCIEVTMITYNTYNVLLVVKLQRFAESLQQEL